MSSLSYTPGQVVDSHTLALGLLGAGVFIGLGVLYQNPEVRPEMRKFFGELAASILHQVADNAPALLAD